MKTRIEESEESKAEPNKKANTTAILAEIFSLQPRRVDVVDIDIADDNQGSNMEDDQDLQDINQADNIDNDDLDDFSINQYSDYTAPYVSPVEEPAPILSTRSPFNP